MTEQMLVFTARKLENAGEQGTETFGKSGGTSGCSEYQPAENFGLNCSYQIKNGTGSAADPYCCEITVTNKNESQWEGVLQIGMRRKRKNPQIFMPGFMYGTNRGDMPMEGQRLCPKIREHLSKPASPWWMVRGDRLSHPVVLIRDDGRIFGLHASPYWTISDGKKCAAIGREKTFLQYAGFSCNAYLTEQSSEPKPAQAQSPQLQLAQAQLSQPQATQAQSPQLEQETLMFCEAGYTLGYENAPWLFIESADARERSGLDGQCFLLKAGETVTFELYLYDFASEKMTDIHRVIEHVYDFYHEAPTYRASVQESVAALANAVSDYAWMPEKKAYSLFVFNRPGSEEMELRELGSFSWTNGMSIATPMLMSALRLGNESMKNQAVTCIDTIVKNCLNPASGLPYDGYSDGKWTLRGWWFDCLKTPGHVGYIVGQGTYYLLKAYEFLKRETGEERKEWLDFARAVIEVLQKQRNSDGEYPFILSEQTGAGIEYDSFGSVWCMTAALLYMEITGERLWLADDKRSEEHYYRDYVAKCQCYGGPLDISKNMDSEGILAYIRAVAILHRLTGEEKYLTHLKDGIEYELTYKFCYNSPVQVPPLGKTGWCSCGGSITSVVNPHIHPMSSSIVDELAYYVGQTGDAYIRSRMEDTVLWGCQTYNHFDGEMDYGKYGWMSERFCYSQGLLKEHYPDGSLASTWFALMPWASASVLEGLAGTAWGW